MSMVHPSKKKTQRQYFAPAQERLTDYGIDQICQDIGDLLTMSQIAYKVRVGVGRLSEWIDIDPERCALVRAARSRTAVPWDEYAMTKIEAATDALELGKAREIATHVRWRTGKIRPQDYGEKVQVTHTGQIEHRLVSDDEINRRLAQFSGVTIDEDGQLIEE